ncbi:hypothetical protein [Sideroxydans sp. CL21]|nr:hypothetical protein [Sideroxydans sp. CL21]
MTPSYSQMPCQGQRLDFNGVYREMSCSKPDKTNKTPKTPG